MIIFLWFLIGFFASLNIIDTLQHDGKISLTKEQIALLVILQWFGIVTLAISIFKKDEIINFIKEF